MITMYLWDGITTMYEVYGILSWNSANKLSQLISQNSKSIFHAQAEFFTFLHIFSRVSVHTDCTRKKKDIENMQHRRSTGMCKNGQEV